MPSSEPEAPAFPTNDAHPDDATRKLALEIADLLREDLLDWLSQNHRDDGLLTADDACAFLAISLRKLDDLAARGAIPVVRIGRARRFPIEGLRAFVRHCSTN